MRKPSLFLLTVVMGASIDSAEAVEPVSGMSITEDTAFDAGTFTLTAAISIASDDVTITGAGQGNTILKVVDDDKAGFNVFEIHHRKGVVVKDLTIEGNKETLKWNPTWRSNERHWNGFHVTNTSNTTIQNVTVVNMGDNGLIWEDGLNNNNHVLDSTFNFNGWVTAAGGVHPSSGAWMAVVNNSSIERCRAEGNGYHGLGMAGDHNTIRGSKAIGNARGGIVLNGATNSLMENNLSISNSEGLVNVGNPASPGQQNVLRNNTTLNSREHGICINVRPTKPADAAIVEYNTINGTGLGGGAWDGLYGADGAYHIIRNNIFNNTTRSGIFLNGTSDALIENNMISNIEDNGIRVEARNNGGYRNRLINNTVTRANRGIALFTSDTFVFGNRTLALRSHGILVVSGSGNRGDENTANSTLGWNDDGTSGATYRSSDPLRYDFNGDLAIDARDIEMLSAAIKSGTIDHKYDMDGMDDGGSPYGVTAYDQQYLVTKIIDKKVGAHPIPQATTVAE